ncbi:MAG: hypothetical protein IMZ43_06740 [Thermoplasmata archaeon]|nr:hypothetical protein [Thermoplasmata archaeon]
MRHVIQQSRWLKSILCSTPWGAEADRQGVLGDKESEEFERRLQPKAKGEPAVGSI